MSTHHTLIAKTTLALSDSDWNKVFNTAGELLNIGWEQLAPHEKMLWMPKPEPCSFGLMATN